MTETINKNWKTIFGAIWTGQAFSLLGSSLVQFALVWWLTQTTGSATVLATSTLVAMLPQIFLGPFAGAIVDRIDRKKVMIIADGSTALVTLGLVFIAWQGALQPWHIFVAMFLRSLGQAFQWPAMQSSTSLLVPDEHMARVAGMNQALQGGMNIVAPPLGALLLAWIPLHWVLSIDIITALMAILPLFFVVIPQPVHQTAMDSKSPIKTILADTKEGFVYVWAWKGLMYIILMAVLINFLINPAFTLMPLLVSKHFNGGAVQYSWMESLTGIGIVAGGVILSVWGGFKRKVYTCSMGLVGMGAGILLIGMAPASLLVMALCGACLVGITNPLVNGPLFAIVQVKVDKEKQGRVMTMINSFCTAMSPIGMLIAGPVSDRYGLQPWFIMGGVMCVLMALAIFAIREVATIEDQNPGEASAPHPSTTAEAIQP
jgi:DHA3 family macrolide efflux protein-like MFS transporter